MKVEEQINLDYLNAFKNKETAVVDILRLLKAALINKKVALKFSKAEILPDEEVVAVLKSEVKKRQDSILAYQQGNRQDLADKEQKEIEIINRYLPAQLDQEKLKEIVKQTVEEIGATGAADFGKAIAAVMAKVKSQADGQMVSAFVKEQLNQ